MFFLIVIVDIINLYLTNKEKEGYNWKDKMINPLFDVKLPAWTWIREVFTNEKQLESYNQ